MSWKNLKNVSNATEQVCIYCCISCNIVCIFIRPRARGEEIVQNSQLPHVDLVGTNETRSVTAHHLSIIRIVIPKRVVWKFGAEKDRRNRAERKREKKRIAINITNRQKCRSHCTHILHGDNRAACVVCCSRLLYSALLRKKYTQLFSRALELGTLGSYGADFSQFCHFSDSCPKIFQLFAPQITRVNFPKVIFEINFREFSFANRFFLRSAVPRVTWLFARLFIVVVVIRGKISAGLFLCFSGCFCVQCLVFF